MGINAKNKSRANVTKMRNGATHFYRRPTHARSWLFCCLRFSLSRARISARWLSRAGLFNAAAAARFLIWHTIAEFRSATRLISMRALASVGSRNVIWRSLILYYHVIAQAACESPLESRALELILRAHYHTNRNVCVFVSLSRSLMPQNKHQTRQWAQGA